MSNYPYYPEGEEPQEPLSNEEPDFDEADDLMEAAPEYNIGDPILWIFLICVGIILAVYLTV